MLYTKAWLALFAAHGYDNYTANAGNVAGVADRAFRNRFVVRVANTFPAVEYITPATYALTI